MISDSPYHTENLILPPIVGLTGGVFASMVGLGIFFISRSASGLLAVPDSVGHLTGATGMGLCGIAGGLFGMLYAGSQRRAGLRDLVSVGLFYGVLLWILGGLAGRMLMDPTVAVALRSVPWLWSTLGYGVSLAILAAIWQVRHPAVRAAETKD